MASSFETRSSPSQQFLDRFSPLEVALVIALGCLVVLRLWISPLRSSLWVDETGTVWAIRGTFQDVLARLRVDQFPQMPLFCIFMWAWSKIAGLGDVALRIPSVVAMFSAAALLFRLTRRLAGPVAAAYSILLLASQADLSFAAVDARPYAIAIFCVVWAFYERVRWLDTGRTVHLVLNGIAWGIVINFNYFFAAALAADLGYVLIAHRFGWLRIRPAVLVSPIITGLMVLPLIPTLLAITSHKQLHVVADPPHWTELGLVFAPSRWIVAAVVAIAIGWLLFPKRAGLQTGWDVPKLVLAAVWAFFPPLLLFAYSVLSGASVMLPRYLLSQTPGLVLLAAWGWSRLQPSMMRFVLAFVLFGMCLSVTGRSLWNQHSQTDWRAVSAIVNRLREADPSLPVLMGSWFVESGRVPLPVGPSTQEYLLAPLTAYPVSTPVTMLPIQMTPQNSPYVSSLLDDAVKTDRFVVVLPPMSPILIWVMGRTDAGFTHRELHDNPVVMMFEKRH